LLAPDRTARPWRIFDPLLRLAEEGRELGVRARLLGLQLLLLGGGYVGVLRVAEALGRSAFDPTTAIDRWVPALPWTFSIYTSLYLWFVVTAFAAPRGRRGAAALAFLFQTQLILSLASWACFLLWPTEIVVRETMRETLAAEADWSAPFALLYRLDAPWNAWPSLHVSLSLPMLLSCLRFARGKWSAAAGRALGAFAWLAWLALGASILTTKQHFLLDLWSGTLLGALAWWLYLRPRLERVLEPAPQKA